MDASLVTRLAALSELDLTPEEAESLAQDLQRILRHVEEIAALRASVAEVTDDLVERVNAVHDRVRALS